MFIVVRKRYSNLSLNLVQDILHFAKLLEIVYKQLFYRQLRVHSKVDRAL